MPERAICKNKGNCAKISQKMMAIYFGKEGIETKCSEFIIPGKKKKYPKNGPNKKYHHDGKEGIEPTKLGMERRE